MLNKSETYLLETALAKVTQCLLDLKHQRFLLDEDVVNLLQQATRQKYWDR
jgi:hypothetical protein